MLFLYLISLFFANALLCFVGTDHWKYFACRQLKILSAPGCCNRVVRKRQRQTETDRDRQRPEYNPWQSWVSVALSNRLAYLAMNLYLVTTTKEFLSSFLRIKRKWVCIYACNRFAIEKRRTKETFSKSQKKIDWQPPQCSRCA